MQHVLDMPMVAEPGARFTIYDRPWHCAVGLDGVFRITETERPLDIACRGRWTSEETFVLDWQRIGAPVRSLAISFTTRSSGQMPLAEGLRTRSSSRMPSAESFRTRSSSQMPLAEGFRTRSSSQMPLAESFHPGFRTDFPSFEGFQRR